MGERRGEEATRDQESWLEMQTVRERDGRETQRARRERESVLEKRTVMLVVAAAAAEERMRTNSNLILEIDFVAKFDFKNFQFLATF